MCRDLTLPKAGLRLTASCLSASCSALAVQVQEDVSPGGLFFSRDGHRSSGMGGSGEGGYRVTVLT